MRRTGLTTLIAVVAVALSTGIAIAEEAIVTRDSPLYRNRTGNSIVNEVFEGDIVDVSECRSNRCRVRPEDGPRGWIRQNRLAPLDDEGDAVEGVPFSFGITIGPGGPSISIGAGGGGGGGGPSSGPRACVYVDAGYAGGSQCFRPGDRVNNLSSIGWNDTISSVRVYGGAAITLCTNAGGGAPCYDYYSNTPSVGGAFNDQASYLEVY